VLDLACGTGLVAKQFRGRVREVVGVDVTEEMARQAEGHVDRMVIAPVEALPFPDSSADVCVCRQGLQFVDLPKALSEVSRVLRPGGRAVFCHLSAYGEEDEADAFRIQALRNPSRVNFFRPGDMEKAMETAGLKVVGSARYLSEESVRQWIEHGANTEAERRAVFEAYRNASPAFKRLHKLREDGDDILDTMLFLIVRAVKP
jgi:ubiquinone/menaquinone biosynthesis C-methylase UbiE